MRPAPRLFGICATAADVVAVLRRGPSDWTHLGLWDLTSEQFHSGSWLRARVYQQRCDLSPDGRYLCYFALNGGAQWDAGDTYIAVSRLPWFTALAAWGELTSSTVPVTTPRAANSRIAREVSGPMP